MHELEWTKNLPVPPAEVFEMITDPDRFRDWNPIVETVRNVSDRPLQLGAAWQETKASPDGDGAYEAAARVVEFEEGRRFAAVFESERAVIHRRFELGASDGGTRAKYMVRIEPRGWWRRLQGRFAAALAKHEAGALPRIKAVLVLSHDPAEL